MGRARAIISARVILPALNEAKRLHARRRLPHRNRKGWEETRACSMMVAPPGGRPSVSQACSSALIRSSAV